MDPRIHFLLGDGVADDGQAVAGVEQQAGGRGRFDRLKLGKERIVRFRFQFRRQQRCGVRRD